MSDFLDSESQVNRFILAMKAAQSSSRTYRQSSNTQEPNSTHAQSDDPSPPPEGEEEAPSEEISEDPSFDGGIALTMEETHAIHTPVSPLEAPVGAGEKKPTAISSPEVASPIVTGLRPPPPTPQTAAHTHIDDELDSGDIVQDILGTFASFSPYTLADSIHAPRHIKASIAANRGSPQTPSCYTNARDMMQGNQFTPLSTLPETDFDFNPSKIEDTDAFVAAMRAKVPAPKSTSTESSGKTDSSETTVTATSDVTAKNKENQPFGKQEALGLLVSPPRKSNKESYEGTKQYIHT
jgi:hypothetical protein